MEEKCECRRNNFFGILFPWWLIIKCNDGFLGNCNYPEFSWIWYPYETTSLSYNVSLPTCNNEKSLYFINFRFSQSLLLLTSTISMSLVALMMSFWIRTWIILPMVILNLLHFYASFSNHNFTLLAFIWETVLVLHFVLKLEWFPITSPSTKISLMSFHGISISMTILMTLVWIISLKRMTRSSTSIPVTIYSLLLLLLILGGIANQAMYYTRSWKDLGIIFSRFILIMSLPTSLMSPKNKLARMTSLTVSLITMMIVQDVYGESLFIVLLSFEFIWLLPLHCSQNDHHPFGIDVKDVILALRCVFWSVICIFILDMSIFFNPIDAFDVSVRLLMVCTLWPYFCILGKHPFDRISCSCGTKVHHAIDIDFISSLHIFIWLWKMLHGCQLIERNFGHTLLHCLCCWWLRIEEFLVHWSFLHCFSCSSKISKVQKSTVLPVPPVIECRYSNDMSERECYLCHHKLEYRNSHGMWYRVMQKFRLTSDSLM